MNDLQGKELIKSYKEQGFTVNTYRPIMSEKERQNKDAQIKYELLDTLKNSHSSKDKLKPV